MDDPRQTVIPGENGGFNESQGYHRAWFDDPFGADVNSVNTRLRWRWTGLSVVDIIACPTNFAWFVWTGWEKKSSGAWCEWTGSHAHAHAYAKFENYPFCNTFYGTWTEYNQNHTSGFGNGALGGQAQMTKWGECNELLQAHTQLVREWG
jgi:hypothetical protein